MCSVGRPCTSGPCWTDLEKLRLEYFIRETRMTGAEIAAALGTRSKWSVYQYMWRRGISLVEERRGEREDAWAGV